MTGALCNVYEANWDRRTGRQAGKPMYWEAAPPKIITLRLIILEISEQSLSLFSCLDSSLEYGRWSHDGSVFGMWWKIEPGRKNLKLEPKYFFIPFHFTNLSSSWQVVMWQTIYHILCMGSNIPHGKKPKDLFIWTMGMEICQIFDSVEENFHQILFNSSKLPITSIFTSLSLLWAWPSSVPVRLSFCPKTFMNLLLVEWWHFP